MRLRVFEVRIALSRGSILKELAGFREREMFDYFEVRCTFSFASESKMIF